MALWLFSFFALFCSESITCQQLYYQEIFDTEGIEWEIDQKNVIRRKDETGSFDTETKWGKLGFIDDWFLERVELKSGDWSPSQSTIKTN